MMIGWKLIATLAILMMSNLDMVTCADSNEIEGSIAHGQKEVHEVESTPIPEVSAHVNATIIHANVTVHPALNSTVLPPTNSTGTGEEEKPITEQIRTYIEDSVKSVKHAISKIGKFVGEFFDEKTNSTIPANSSTTVSHASTTVINVTTVLPTTISEATEKAKDTE